MKRRTLILMLGGTSAGALTFGSGAFRSTTAERGVNIDVVPDDQGLVGYEVREDVVADESKSEFPEVVVASGENVEQTLVTVVNRFGGDPSLEIVDVEVTTQGDGEPIVADVDWDEGPFKSTADIRGSIVCSEAGSNIVELTVVVEGTGVTASLSGDRDTRKFAIRCEPDSLPDLTSEFLPGTDGKVAFDGLGQVELKHDDQGMVDVRFYVGNQTGANKQMSVNLRSVEKVKTNQKVGGNRFSSESVVGIRIGDSDSIYLHPSWNQNGCKFDKGSGGTVSDPVSIENADLAECTSQ